MTGDLPSHHSYAGNKFTVSGGCYLSHNEECAGLGWSEKKNGGERVVWEKNEQKSHPETGENEER